MGVFSDISPGTHSISKVNLAGCCAAARRYMRLCCKARDWMDNPISRCPKHCTMMDRFSHSSASSGCCPARSSMSLPRGRKSVPAILARRKGANPRNAVSGWLCSSVEEGIFNCLAVSYRYFREAPGRFRQVCSSISRIYPGSEYPVATMSKRRIEGANPG